MPTPIDHYINQHPDHIQQKLRQLRAILKDVAPNATESLKWGNPVFEEKRILFAYAAYKNHLNFMPTPSALKPFAKELAHYKTGKGSVQFPYTDPLPKELIRNIAQYRLKDVRKNDARWM